MKRIRTVFCRSGELLSKGFMRGVWDGISGDTEATGAIQRQDRTPI